MIIIVPLQIHPESFNASRNPFPLILLTLYGHIKTAEQRNTVIGTLAVDGWARRILGAQSPPRCIKCNILPINQRPVYQLHIVRCGTVIASALYKGLSYKVTKTMS